MPFVYGEAQDVFSINLEGKVPFSKAENLKEATQMALAHANNDTAENKVIMLSPACSSFDQFRDFEVRGRAFCDYVEELTK